MSTKKILNVLLAEDDKDDRFFFEKALKKIPIHTKLTMVVDGEQLLNYISTNKDNLPDVLFTDLNMPRKNGMECLVAIRAMNDIKEFPIIIYSTSLDESVADLLYYKGAHHYLRKSNFLELEKNLIVIFNLLEEYNFEKPPREKYILAVQEA